MPKYIKLNSEVDYYKFKRKAEWLETSPKIKEEVNDRWVKNLNEIEYLNLVGHIDGNNMWNVDLVSPIPLKDVITLDQFIRTVNQPAGNMCEYDKLKLL